MPKRAGLTTFFVVLLLEVSAQQKWNFVDVDKKSYELYQQQKWTELIDYSREARARGIDFFYLQARTGIAYFNLKKYRKASDWFLKAWENDKNFDWLQEYLYYSLIYGGRGAEAAKIAADFSESVQQKIDYARSTLTRIALEAGYAFNPDIEQLKTATHDELAAVGNNYGEAFYLNNYHFESFDLSHLISPGINLNHNFTYVGVSREQRIDWGNENFFPAKTNQFQYFVNPAMVFGNKFYASPSLSLIWGNFSYSNGGISGNNRFFGDANVYYRDLVFSISAWSHFGNFSPGIEYNYANISDKGLNQYSVWLTFYPFSNTGFYITPRAYFKSSEEKSFEYNTFGISGGLQLGPAHFYGQYLTGEMENFIESAGYVVANFPGTSSRKFSGSIYFPTGKKYQFVVRYINQDITETYRVYTSGIQSNSIDYSYIKHTLTGGISWNF